MAKRKTVQCARLFGGFRKMPRDMARRIMLEDYDRAPIKCDALLEAMNLRLKGATMQEFLAERGA
ncbi:MAG: hypothetical protein FWG38_01645 [Defluviitaleaceae bacterium]|nr:hypothetical protein [Defluviitaleaceae bacterium]